MTLRRNALAASIVAGLAIAGAAHAQQADAPPPAAAADAATELDSVVVTGIRGALVESLSAKRDEVTRVEVISAEDIGKMPDKNVADSLARVPGVNISAASANEGAFDENDRVSMRGTSPSFTQTLVDGHNIASGDWFVLNQTGTVGRSVSYSLLPAELVDQVLVRKSAEAKLVEGGLAGSIDIRTRSPLNFDTGLSLFGSVGAVYADLPGKTDPQISVLGNWKNADGTFGATLQLFRQERHLRRDGQEILGYERIAPGSAIALSNPDLAGVFYPVLIGSALFEQERVRTGGMLSVQWKPTDSIELGAKYFRSDLGADNYNRNYLLWGSRVLAQGAGQAPLPGYVVRNNTLVQADFAGDPARPAGIYDQISRPGAESGSEFLSVDAKWDVNERLRFSAQLGASDGYGRSPVQDVAEWDIGFGQASGWRLDGVGAADWNLGNTNTTQPGTPGVDYGLDWIFGFQDIDVEDKERWGQVDGQYFFEGGLVSSFEFGLRQADHERSLDQVTAQGPNFAAPSSPFNPANWPQGFTRYPGDFGSGLGGSFPRDIWQFNEDQLAEFNRLYANRDPVSRFFFAGAYGLEETSRAGYLQMNLGGERWTANVGMRVVRTEFDSTNYVAATDPSAPGVINTSAFGPYRIERSSYTYTDWLPSANLKVDLADDVVLRLAASRTLSRPDYSALAGAVSLSPPAVVATGVGSGTAGNPALRPILSTNLDATVEWYFAERALLSLGVFNMEIDDYVALSTVRRSYLTEDRSNPAAPVSVQVPYDLTIPVGTQASVTGAELAFEMPFGEFFGVFANYTYAEGDTEDGSPMLGTSENTYNAGVYFENDRFNARVNYTYRSEFYSGLDRASAFYQDEIDDVSASFGWTINDALSLSFDALNLNNPKTQYYAENRDRPRSVYLNGRQYYLNLRFRY